jgi:hypothetical protein
MMAFLHWIGSLLWALLQASVGVLMWASVTVVVGLAAIYVILAIVAPLLKEHSSFKRTNGQSKGPINPYANPDHKPEA